MLLRHAGRADARRYPPIPAFSMVTDMLVLEIALGILLAPVLGVLIICAFSMVIRVLTHPLVQAALIIILLLAFLFIIPGSKFSKFGAGDVLPFVGVIMLIVLITAIVAWRAELVAFFWEFWASPRKFFSKRRKFFSLPPPGKR
jgi:hypothetical protein